VDFAAGAGFLTERNLGLDATFYEQEARGEGVKVFYGAESFGNVKTEYDRVLCLGGKDLKELPFAIDRKEGDTALKDFVTTGIDYLYGRYAEEGFFFMIEGGKIDYAGHNDDAASCFREINDFAEALDVVLAFCDRHPGETLIVVTADHETGGLALGAGEYKMNPELLACQKMSENELTSKFRQAFMPPPPPQRRGPRNGQGMAPQQPQWTPPTWEEVKEFLKVNLGLWDTVPVDKRTEERFFETYQTTFGAKEGESEVRSLYAVNTRLVSDAVMYLDRAAGYQWAHGAHTGSPVGLYVSGVRAAEFNSCSENTDIPLVIARIAGYDIQH
jgi:alkaline phosphatase